MCAHGSEFVLARSRSSLHDLYDFLWQIYIYRKQIRQVYSLLEDTTLAAVGSLLVHI